MKYINLYTTKTQYEADNRPTPSVSYIKEGGKVKYEPIKRYIPTPGLSNEEDIVELANLYIDEYNIENGTNLQLKYSIEESADFPTWYDDCSNKESKCYLGILDNISTSRSNMLRVQPSRKEGYYCYYFPESGCCKIEYYKP